MKFIDRNFEADCAFESEALAAAVECRWPELVDPDLRSHVAACAICSDILAVCRSVRNAREEARARTIVPDPGLVWWRAQLRGRREAAEAAGSPITATQIVALACTAGLLGACFGATSGWFQSVLGKTTSTVAAFNVRALLSSTSSFLAGHEALVFLIAALLLFIPTAVYLAVLRE